MSTLRVTNLVKRYGDRRVLDGLNLSVEPGTIVGLVGPNGAGKTTLFKCLLDFARPTEGSVAIFGAPVGPSTFERLAYAGDESVMFVQALSYVRVNDMFEFQRRSFPARYDAARAKTVREQFGIAGNRRLAELSKGQRTALRLALAFSIRPDLYIFDEPTTGLDPEHQRVLLDLMIESASDGEASVLFSSHQISQVERAADRVAVLRNGTIVLDAEIETLRTRERIIQAIFERDVPAPNGLASDPRVRKIERTDRMLRLYISDGEDDIVRKLEALSPRALERWTPDLEAIYLNTGLPPTEALKP